MSTESKQAILSKRDLRDTRNALIEETKQRYRFDTAYSGGHFENMFRALERGAIRCEDDILGGVIVGALIGLVVASAVGGIASLFDLDWWSVYLLLGGVIGGVIALFTFCEFMDYLVSTKESRRELRQELQLIRNQDEFSLFGEWCNRELTRLRDMLDQPTDSIETDVGHLEHQLKTLEGTSTGLTNADARERREQFRGMLQAKISDIRDAEEAQRARLARLKERDTQIRHDLRGIEELTRELSRYEDSTAILPDAAALIRDTKEQRDNACFGIKARILALRENLEHEDLLEED